MDFIPGHTAARGGLLARRHPSWWRRMMSGAETAGSPADLAPASSLAPTGDNSADGGGVTAGAFDLHARATAESAVQGRGGFVPAGWLEGQATKTEALVAELCAAQVWEPAEGGYRILDRDATERCRDLVEVLWAGQARARSRIRDRDRDDAQSQLMPERAAAMVASPVCAACGVPASRIELVAPGELPAKWGQWPGAVRDSVARKRDPGQWWLIVDGVVAGNGYGSPVSAGQAGLIAHAFSSPLRLERVRVAGFYDDAGFCDQCAVPYCGRHWHVSQTGYGICPLGHGRSLDEHWSSVQD